MIYLACPYSHPDMAVCEARFEAANRAAAKLIAEGHVVFSPISMTHPIALIMGNHLSAAWYGFDEPFIEASDACVVLKIDGWDRSKGVAAEVAWFKERGRPVTYMEPA